MSQLVSVELIDDEKNSVYKLNVCREDISTFAANYSFVSTSNKNLLRFIDNMEAFLEDSEIGQDFYSFELKFCSINDIKNHLNKMSVISAGNTFNTKCNEPTGSLLFILLAFINKAYMYPYPKQFKIVFSEIENE